MTSYKSFFKVLLTTDKYISVDLIKEYIQANKTKSLEPDSLTREINRKFQKFVELGILKKEYNGSDTVYTRTELTRELHSTYGAEKLLSAYDLLELTKASDFEQVVTQLATLLDIHDDISFGFVSPQLKSILQPTYKLRGIYNLIKSFQEVMSN